MRAISKESVILRATILVFFLLIWYCDSRGMLPENGRIILTILLFGIFFGLSRLDLLNPLEQIKTRRGDLGCNLSSADLCQRGCERRFFSAPKVYGEKNVRSKLCHYNLAAGI